MSTFKRICVTDYVVFDDSGNKQPVERGKEYTTSDVHLEDGTVTVFSMFWVRMPKSLFAGERRFT